MSLRAVALSALVICFLASCVSTTTNSSRNGGRPSNSQSAPGSDDSPAQFNVQLAIGYMDRGQLDVALDKANRALEQDPNYAPAHTVAAVIYDEIDDHDAARKHYRRAMALDPNNGDVHNNYGTFLCQQDDYKEAMKEFRAAASSRFYNTPQVAYANAGSCAREMGDLDTSEDYLRSAIQADPEYGYALYLLAEVMADKAEFMAARAFLSRYESLATESPDSLWLGYRIERELGDEKSARNYSAVLKQRFPESEQARRLKESQAND
ncbi:MAG: type IV pilus biogenesis/stability protein PilW [Lysobacteraceae bacterium]|nr:MAG: type IV pilus biogenesis/stability protein PilW [Xanthomonadaceae bacterium]